MSLILMFQCRCFVEEERQACMILKHTESKSVRDSITLFLFSNNKYNVIKIYRYFCQNFLFYNFFFKGEKDWLLKESCNRMTHKLLDLYYIASIQNRTQTKHCPWHAKNSIPKENCVFWQIYIIDNCFRPLLANRMNVPFCIVKGR